MTKNPFARAVPAARLGAALSIPALPARADVKDYRFELVQQAAKVGEAAIAVRLVDPRSGQPVPDTVVFAKRLDPEGRALGTVRQPEGGRDGRGRVQPRSSSTAREGA